MESRRVAAAAAVVAHQQPAAAASSRPCTRLILEPLGWAGVNIWVVINFIGGALKAQSAEARLGPHLGLHWPGTVAELDGTASECWCLDCFAAVIVGSRGKG